MESTAEAFLQDLLETPSPSGFEQPVQRLVKRYLEDSADSIEADVHGNVIACANPGAPVRVLFDGHCDQIGMLVSHIDETGFVFAQTIGGWDPQQLIGQRMNIWGRNGTVEAVMTSVISASIP